MDNNTQNIPADILQAIESSRVYDKLEKIAGKYGLLLDQLGYLNMYTEQAMIGKLKSVDFVPTIAKNLEISTDIAQKITFDINNEVFSMVRESLQKIQEERKDPVEKAGNFTLERRPASQSPQYNETNLKRDAVLADLENIKNLQPDKATAFVDHLLGTSRKNADQKTGPSTGEVQKPKIDPYREPV